MIPDEDIERALTWLASNAIKAASARAQREYLDEFRRSKRAVLMSQSDAKTVSERETYAYMHPEYLELLEGYKAAVEADEKNRWLLEAAKAKIEVWRSQQANARTQEKVT